MNTLAMENRPSPTLFHSNPVLSRLSRVTERASDDAATYSGTEDLLKTVTTFLA